MLLLTPLAVLGFRWGEKHLVDLLVLRRLVELLEQVVFQYLPHLFRGFPKQATSLVLLEQPNVDPILVGVSVTAAAVRESNTMKFMRADPLMHGGRLAYSPRSRWAAIDRDGEIDTRRRVCVLDPVVRARACRLTQRT